MDARRNGIKVQHGELCGGSQSDQERAMQQEKQLRVRDSSKGIATTIDDATGTEQTVE